MKNIERLGKPTEGQSPKRKLKRLVFAALATNGAIGLAALVSAQAAHGNASSHVGVQLDWDYDNFVIRRDEQTEPPPPPPSDTLQLQRGVQQFGLQTSKPSALALQVKPTLRPITRRVLDQLTTGHEREAIAAIEASSADPMAVMKEFSLIQLDLMNYSAVDGVSTPATLPAVITVSRAGLAFQAARLPNDITLAASLLHNLASAAAPDSGSVTPEQQQIGRKAASDALAFREQLGDRRAIGIAEYMVGVYQYREKKFADAEKTFSSARAKLASARPNEANAWASLFLGYTELALGKADGQALVDEAKSMFANIGSTYGQRYAREGFGKN